MVLRKDLVDPDSIAKDHRYSDDFRVEIHFNNVCERCKPERAIKDLCSRCQREMETDIAESWLII